MTWHDQIGLCDITWCDALCHFQSKKHFTWYTSEITWRDRTDNDVTNFFHKFRYIPHIALFIGKKKVTEILTIEYKIYANFFAILRLMMQLRKDYFPTPTFHPLLRNIYYLHFQDWEINYSQIISTSYVYNKL